MIHHREVKRGQDFPRSFSALVNDEAAPARRARDKVLGLGDADSVGRHHHAQIRPPDPRHRNRAAGEGKIDPIRRLSGDEHRGFVTRQAELASNARDLSLRPLDRRGQLQRHRRARVRRCSVGLSIVVATKRVANALRERAVGQSKSRARVASTFRFERLTNARPTPHAADAIASSHADRRGEAHRLKPLREGCRTEHEDRIACACAADDLFKRAIPGLFEAEDVQCLVQGARGDRHHCFRVPRFSPRSMRSCL